MAPAPGTSTLSHEEQIFRLTVMQTVVTYIGLLAIFLTITTLVSQRYLRLRNEDKNRFACDSTRIGVFYASKPSHLDTILGRQTQLAQIPNIQTILALGDAQAWTSTALLHASQNLSKSSWVILYEAIFQQVANQVEHRQTLALALPQTLRRYIIRTKVASAEHKNDPFKATDPFYCEPDTWLINCTRSLDQAASHESRPGNPGGLSKALERHQYPHIYNDRIWLKSSDAELLALALTLGMPLEVHEITQHLRGRGAFSSCIDAKTQSYGTTYNFSIGQGYQVDSGVPSCSGGYTTVMSRNIACGAIPFAQTEKCIYSVFVNDDVVDAIQEGRPISSLAGPGGDGMQQLWQLPSAKQIVAYFGSLTANKLPHSSMGKILRLANVEYPVQLRSSLDNTLFDASWSRVVVNIAFGGLVPLATQRLTTAVLFTCGAPSTGIPNALEALMNDLFACYRHIHGQDAKLIFGSYICQRVNDQDAMDCDNFEDDQRLSTNEAYEYFHRYMTLLEVMAAIAFRCHAFHLSSPLTAPSRVTFSEIVFPTSSNTKIETSPRLSDLDTKTFVEMLLNHSAKYIDRVYQTAVAKNVAKSSAAKIFVKGIDASPSHLAPEPENNLVHALNELRMKFRQTPAGAVTLDDFAIVVRCVVIAWASQVPLRTFDDDQPSTTSKTDPVDNLSYRWGGRMRLQINRSANLEDITPGVLS